MDTIIIKNPSSVCIAEGGGRNYHITVGDLSQVSDGYHSIQDLYEHRITLYIALCRQIEYLDYPFNVTRQKAQRVWRSKFHSGGNPAYDGWFIMGIGNEKGKQISYHIPLSRWDETEFAMTIDKAPEWDGHSSADVIERLKKL